MRRKVQSCEGASIDMLDDRFERMLRRLSPSDFQIKHMDLSLARTPYTGGWIFEHPKFKAWTKPGVNSIRTLWFKGIGDPSIVIIANDMKRVVERQY